ncbi:MgtC/SapB family protein [uncultured Thiodictyon sp.]|uniref:MgtC/SapB family protein n=1 Tax=uncultured Thiodictyon sp. TaxID=1846217 RepID=UPI0025DB2D34|nr:MgtC/SapB family protein [uncultured Thiodictyon sp.]
MLPAQATFYHLGAALAIGLLIGVERGWSERDEQDGTRVAGVRTFALIGLLGGATTLIGPPLGAWLAALGLLALGVLFATAYAIHARSRPDRMGITVPVAGLLTFVLGALAASGQVAVAAAAAVVATLLLSAKPVLHHWLTTLQGQELAAGLQLLLLSVVVLPLLPNRGYGPWQALNPYRLWWMVVLIAAMSFVGYFAVKEAGARKGAIFTGIFAGLASSTALTLHFARLARAQPELSPTLATGILLACGTMFPRMALVLAVAAPNVLLPALLPLGLMTLVVYGAALRQWWTLGDASGAAVTSLRNPLELTAAIGFGAFLALVMVLARGVEVWLGSTGVLALAAASGVADVDAITLSLVGMSRTGLGLQTVVTGIVIAAASNSLVKGAMATTVSGRRLGASVALPLALAALVGPLAVWITLW